MATISTGQSLVIAHPHIKCYINGQLLGYVTSVAWQQMLGHKDARGIDIPTVQEFIPTTYGVRGTFGVYRARSGGGLEGAAIAPFSDQLPMEKYITIELIDRVSGNTIARFVNAVVDGQSWQANPKGLLEGSFSFRAAAFGNEAYQASNILSVNIPLGL